MSEIKPIFDNRPVYLGSDGFPLIYGKLKFFDIGTTNTKAVYSDYYRNTSAGVEVILDNVGRSETQLFAGEGDYSVYSYKFNGTDPLTAEESEWSLDNEWVQNGCTAITSNANTLAIVNTISDLRDLDQTANSVALVLGYYNAGDRQPIIYSLKTNADSDNGGTIIKSPSIAGKSWIYAPESQTVNASIFGLIPYDTAFKNSLLASACAYCYSANKTLYIPKGLYYFEAGNLTVNCDVFIDNSVTFRCDFGRYVINIYKHFDIRLTNDIKNPMSTGDVYFQFQKKCEGSYIDASWFGANYDNSTDCGAAFEKTVWNVIDNSIPIRISGQARITSLSADIEFKNDILFEDEGFIRNSQATHNIVFNSIELINNSPMYKRSYVIYAENLNKYKLKNIANIRASLFENSGSISDPITLDLSQYINNFQVEGNRVQFILDVKQCSFTSNIPLSKGANYDVVCDGGFIYASGLNLYFNSVLNPEYGYFVAYGNFIALTGYTKFKWFLPLSPLVTESTSAWIRALYGAGNGSGVLEMDGLTANIGSTMLDLTITSNKNLKVKNGSIDILDSGKYAFPFSGSALGNFSLENISVYSTTGNEFGLLKLSAASFVSSFLVSKCSFICGVASSIPSIYIYSNSSISQVLKINDSIFSCYTIFGEISGSRIGWYDLSSSVFDCGIVLYGKQGTLVDGCSISTHDLYIYSYASTIKGNINNCDSTTGAVYIIAEQSSAKLQGLNVSDNSIPNVYLANGAGTFDLNSYKHKCIIKNNANENGIARFTSGICRLSITNSDIPSASVGDFVETFSSIPSEILTLPSGEVGGNLDAVGTLYSDNSTGYKVANFYSLLGVTEKTSDRTKISVRLRKDYSNTEASDAICYLFINFTSYR